MKKVDFALTPSGDLAFIENYKNNEKLNIEFYFTQSRALKIDFSTVSNLENIYSNTRLNIVFDFASRKNNKRISALTSNAYIEQQILLNLKTPIGEIKNRKSLGSDLESSMHKNIYDSKTLSEIESKVSKVVNNKISNYIIKATPVINRNSTYKQTISVKIYTDTSTINYEI